MSKKILLTKEVKHLANLAKLKLTDKQINKLKKQLSETLDFIDNLNSLDTLKIPTTNQTTNLSNIFFEDGDPNLRGLDIEQALGNALKKKNGYFNADKILND